MRGMPGIEGRTIQKEQSTVLGGLLLWLEHCRQGKRGWGMADPRL